MNRTHKVLSTEMDFLTEALSQVRVSVGTSRMIEKRSWITVGPIEESSPLSI
ncbi:hypothetical protein ABEW19_28195 [Paenibacillus illinoisensis]|uniref:hypothetical protein n=1 Tax=Paenibacillus illinoisensis TaxID=59845 RepID=UPI003D27B085